MLTEEHKKIRVDGCADLPSRLQAEIQTFLDKVVAQHESLMPRQNGETEAVQFCHRGQFIPSLTVRRQVFGTVSQ